MQAKKLVRSVSKVICLYGLATWVWVAVSVLDPVTAPFQTAALSFYVDIPTDLVGIVGFTTSAVGAFVWEYLRD